ncbi:MAG: sigma-70 family RNA polymerase sigma factor [Clostridia bacterium]|nr:sigma-70 family RNA polymerase sigma factor [Clostridia bacterium]
MLNEYEIEAKCNDSENEYQEARALYSGKSNEVLKKYFDEISSFKTLPREEVNRLIELARKGDTFAKNSVINSFLKFVVSIAKRYFTSDIDPMDLISEGNLGLAKAFDKFDISRNSSFSTYAYHYINGNILSYLNAHYNLNNASPKLYSLVKRVKEYRNQYFQENGRKPSNENILQACKINEKQLQRVELFSNPVVSIDDSINDAEGLTIGDLIASDSDEFFENVHKKDDNEFKRASLKKHLGSLTRSERIVLIYTYGLFDKKAKTADQIANYLNVTKRCVEQTKYRAQTKLYLNLQSDIDLYF